MIRFFEISLKTTEETDILDITQQAHEKVLQSGIDDGSMLVFVGGSTGAVTTIEYESGVVNDLRKAIQRACPREITYEHDLRWGDGNGYAHVRAAIVGPSLAVPIRRKRLLLGTWQQIVVLDFDNRPRERKVVIQIMGE
ncbi:MAG: YjbQ family protein [Proteobacteria bacterium]|nr:YjbQ family protein [Pseudomonadota bacterium]NIS68015.1 YjbQ family protein [Pseudomonadota bacterium]